MTPARPSLRSAALAWAFAVVSAASCPGADPARLAYNAGVACVQEGRWSEAERALSTALAAQSPALQPPALYHLGLARFAQGEDTLKRAADPESTRRAVALQTDSLGFLAGSAFAALERPDPDELRSIYRAGRQALKAARQREPGFRQAIEAHEAVLAKWQRAAADFRGAVELDPADEDAAFNAALVEEHIRRLLEKLKPLQQEMQQSGRQQGRLKGALSKVKQAMPPGPGGPGGEEDEDEDGEEEGQTPRGGPQPPSRDGKEGGLTPEEAQRLLMGFQPGGTRPLPAGTGRTEKPTDRKGRDW